MSDKPNYALDIRADPAIAELVRDNTLLGQWQYRADYSTVQAELFVRRAAAEIRQALSTEGRFEPVIHVEPDDPTAPTRIAIDVQAGPQVRVDSVDVEYRGAIAQERFATRRTAFQRNWRLQRGEAFTQSGWSDAKEAVIDALHVDGFPRARLVDSQAQVDVANRRVALKVTIDSGELMTIGRINFSGLERYPESIVTALQNFQTGDPYSLQRLVEYGTILRNTRYFRTVTVLPDLAALQRDPERRSVDVNVRLVEAPSQRLTTGVGISSDRGFRLQLGWTDRNIGGAGNVFDSLIVIDRLSKVGSVGLRTPRDARGGYYGIGARLDQETLRGVRSETASVYAGYGRQNSTREWFASLTYQYDRQTIFSDETPVATTNARALMPGFSWSQHRFDDRLYPTRGHSLSVQLGGAAKALASTQNFVRTYVRGAKFFPLGTEGWFAGDRILVLVEAGAVIAPSREGIPFVDMFRTGGAQSVRGYGYQSLGLSYGSAVLPARYLLATTIEYQHPFTPIIGGAVFYDHGNAFDRPADRALVSGYGVGARLRTPVGPVNLDLAWGQAQRRLRMHFSIGYTF